MKPFIIMFFVVVSLLVTILVVLIVLYLKCRQDSRYKIKSVGLYVYRNKEDIYPELISTWDDARSCGFHAFVIFAASRKLDEIHNGYYKLAIHFNPRYPEYIEVGWVPKNYPVRFTELSFFTIDEFVAKATNTDYLLKIIGKMYSFGTYNEALSRRYDNIASKWSGLAYEGLRRDDLLPEIFQMGELDKLKEDPLILDAMCGTGIVGKATDKYLRGLGIKPEMFFLDTSEKMLEECQYVGTRVRKSILQMPFSDNFFDCIFLRFGLYDLDRKYQKDALKEVWRTLKKGGTFIIITYCPLEDLQHVYNKIVNLKDELSGNKSVKMKRYFATRRELDNMLSQAGFPIAEKSIFFAGTIRYMKTSEMNEISANKWRDYVLKLSEKTRQQMFVKLNEDGTLEYVFPGIAYVIRKQ
jgi:ubiquinone/menaquinone biosynthesis C-methylase UbiE